METPELKPCPFCGTIKERYILYIEDEDRWKMRCDNCDASVEGDSMAQAMEKWNTRAEVKAEEKGAADETNLT